MTPRIEAGRCCAESLSQTAVCSYSRTKMQNKNWSHFLVTDCLQIEQQDYFSIANLGKLTDLIFKRLNLKERATFMYVDHNWLQSVNNW